MKTVGRVDSLEEKIFDALTNREGLRVGEASVVSTQVHTVDPNEPDKVVTVPQDAGQTFYHRKNPGEIIHIDCFHEIGRPDQKKLARDILHYINDLEDEVDVPGWLKDYIDIQTGSGGGRLTGTLEYGQKKTLRDAHLNHVHIALYLIPDNYCLILPLIDGLERGIIKQGYKLKKIERVIVKTSKKDDGDDNENESSFDTSDYASDADTLLKEENNNKSGKPSNEDSNATGEDEDIGDQTEIKEDQSDNIEAQSENINPFENGKYSSENTRDLSEIRSECLDDPAKVQDFVEKLNKGYPKKSIEKEYPRVYNDMDNLLKKNILKEKDGKLYLTEHGKNIMKYMQRHLKDIEFNLKRLAKKLPDAHGALPKKIKKKGDGLTRNYFGKGEVKKREGNELGGPIAITETVVRGAVRSYNEKDYFTIKPEDVHVVKPQKFTSLDLCLLIDASGSMTGRRMKEVKFLAEHLLVTTRDKVSIISFQEDRVEIKVPFTRDRSEMKEGLASLKAAGLTPMAYGIKEGKRYMEREGRKNSMLLLITDGLPTICGGGADPFLETLRAAKELSKTSYKFTCIGLEPNVSFLRKLTDEAGGSLYVVEEFNRESLLKVVKQERQEV
ncbi:vWA domain-containing protein [Natranaerofaba carboxydovora]|uniref:vWA domain-containing protein n=1 Tax=Natranaerofaba carboxydovora TaxID=2742683 RepID=UPI001F12F3EF|nr:VWA domain-containing protein [Natranaerofaba carboxydovora]UMZ72651.1 von Willebrand factor type A domain protein [Natranaerofaba carboxydovora]